jgi:hypothetical protein
MRTERNKGEKEPRMKERCKGVTKERGPTGKKKKEGSQKKREKNKIRKDGEISQELSHELFH